ncbi:SDR family NAD(P)-dependent oxidoreductase [Microbispora sp. NPDC049125]|uniref:SDR family NAD(P)-dependent oxidoreductase n=1 Tax=Microbispora sp. NPDC049125 TaxID=3154929 RepID=UPI0034654A61
MTPFERPDVRLAAAVCAAGALGVVDITCGGPAAVEALGLMRRWDVSPRAVRLARGDVRAWDALLQVLAGADGGDPPDLHVLDTVLLGADVRWTRDEVTGTRRVLAEVTSVHEARCALDAGADGLVARGNEAGGRVGELSTFVLLQQLLSDSALAGVPVWAWGGVAPSTAAACVTGGATGVVLDVQLALTTQARTAPAAVRALRGADGTETVLLGGHRVLPATARPGAPLEELSTAQVVERLVSGDPATALLPVGQDAYLARPAGADVAAVVAGIRAGVRAAWPAAETETEDRPERALPVAQGPMTRVSDVPEFALAVAEEGGLPFVALALAPQERARELLTRTRDLLAGRPWGVGILGFVPEDLRAQQMAVIAEVRPTHAIVAGGRPAHAATLEAAGVTTYLHVPSPVLLDQYLRAGVRRFVFEGAECGGHVGPRNAFPLWQAQLTVLEEYLREQPDAAAELAVYFAGGVHDARSAAMVRAMVRPLTRRGVHAGVLMGTAYLLTQEAVETGAVTPVFQQAVLKAGGTELLETAPGHAVRAVTSPFTEEFERVRALRRSEGAGPRQVWAELEDLNIGRLRIAAKALERTPDGVKPVAEARQRAEGLFMAGQVAVLRSERCTIAQLHEAVTAGAERFARERARTAAGTATAPAAGALTVREREVPLTERDIAIVGMACLFPQADGLRTYWSNILNGTDAVTEVPRDRWDPEVYFDPDVRDGSKAVSKWGGFLPPVPFDALRYGIPPASLASIEPVQLLALEVAARALRDAFGERPFARERTSVIFGAEAGSDLANAALLRSTLPGYFGRVPDALDDQLPRLTTDSFPGMLANVIAGRIANRLDLGGTNYIVDAACASSLAALDIARKELLAGTSDVVICGGADLHNGIGDYLLFSSVQALSPSGRSRPFDHHADGIGLGEGVACLVLKRLADAQRDGDRIYAVIKGIGAASDGKSLGLTAPRLEGQRSALERAYADAGLSPAAVTLVEAHGTGTVVGDRTELRSLTEVFSEAGADPGACTLGSVKSQIGHTKCAAGLAGMVKTAMALHTGVLPPTANIDRPNPAWDAGSSPFAFGDRPRPWHVPHGRRVAGVSAFGFGGTNFHAVLADAPEAVPAATGLWKWPAELVVVPAGDRAGLMRALDRVAALLAANDRADRPRPLRDVAATVASWGLTGSGATTAFVAADLDELAAQVEAVRRERQPLPAGVVTAPPGSSADPASVAFLFPGQGSQSPGMFAELLCAFPDLQHHLHDASPWALPMCPPRDFDEESAAAAAAALTDTRAAQAALGVTALVGRDLLARLGVRPAFAAGHSFGELAALCAAGALDAATFLALSVARGQVVAAAAGEAAGSMAAVSLGEDAVRAVLRAGGLDDRVVAANVNTPRQTVVSGPVDAVDAAVALFREQGHQARRLAVSCAFHSPAVASAGSAFAAELERRPVGVPAIPVFADRTAQPYAADSDQVRAELAAQIAAPVRFVDVVESMYAAGARVFVEIGPGSVLSNFTGTILGDRPHLSVPLQRTATGRGSGLRGLLEALAILAVHGIPLSLDPLFAGRADAIRSTDELPSPPAWLVDGHLVRTADGSPLVGGLRPVRRVQELMMTNDNTGPAADSRDQLVADFLRASRDMLAAQRDVLLTYLGAGAVPGQVAAPGLVAAPVSAPAPLALSAVAAPAPVPVPVLPAPAAPVPVAPPVVDVETTVREVISERTGYPAEMIEPDLDLEADLSIDSIKRMEIAAQLVRRVAPDAAALPDANLEDLSRARTAAAITAWLTDRVAAAPAPVPVPVLPAPVAPVPVAPPVVDVGTTVREVISERTGYPAEMIEPDLDLEADLSIDSIKRMEIAAQLVRRVAPDAAALPDANLEDLSRARTAAAITAWLTAHLMPAPPPVAAAPEASAAPAAAAVPEASAAPAAAAVPAAPPGERPDRYVWREVDAPPVPADDARTRLQGDRVLLLAEAGEDVDGLAGVLREAGMEVVPGGVPSAGATAAERVEQGDHVVLLVPESPAVLLPEVFPLVQAVLTVGVRTLVLVARRAPGAALLDRDAAAEGLRGLVRTAAREFPEVNITLVETGDWEPAALGEALLEELATHDRQPVILRQDGRRLRLGTQRAGLGALAAAGAGPLDDGTAECRALGLGPESVLLVVGGARGITARVAALLASASRGTVILAGRTPLPDTPEEPWTAAASGLEELRAAFVSRGHLPIRTMERAIREILAQREIIDTLRGIERTGGRAEYVTLDVLDDSAVHQVVKEAYERHGRLDGIVYGAGVTVDQLVSRTSMESFRLVYDTKVQGAKAVVDAAAQLPAPPRFVVFFGSVTTVIGSRGQVGYAAANDVLETVGQDWAARTGTRAVTVHWGPWAPVGMHAGMVSPELQRDFLRRDLALIDPDEGPMCLLRELAWGPADGAGTVIYAPSGWLEP